MTNVRMVHPALPPEQEIDVPELAVFGRRRSGWITTDEAEAARSGTGTTSGAAAAEGAAEPVKTAAARRTTSLPSGTDKE